MRIEIVPVKNKNLVQERFRNVTLRFQRAQHLMVELQSPVTTSFGVFNIFYMIWYFLMMSPEYSCFRFCRAPAPKSKTMYWSSYFKPINGQENMFLCIGISLFTNGSQCQRILISSHFFHIFSLPVKTHS